MESSKKQKIFFYSDSYQTIPEENRIISSENPTESEDETKLSEDETESSEDETESSEDDTESSETETESPETVIELSKKQAESPVKQAESSVKQAESPVKQAESPVKQAESLVKRTVSFKEQTKELPKKENQFDPELSKLIDKAEKWQKCELNMIANENIPSPGVLNYRHPCLQNKYRERPLNGRSYGGIEPIEEIEKLAQLRSLNAFDLDPDEWGCNVQSYSRSLANLSVYTALCRPKGRVMAPDVKDGSNYTRGCASSSGTTSSTDMFFETLPYTIDHDKYDISYHEFANCVKLFKPKVITIGTSYPRILNYRNVKEIAEIVGAYVHTDISEIAGLVAARVVSDPFKDSDIVTTATHMTLRGPQGAIIFYRKFRYREEYGEMNGGEKSHEIIKLDLEDKINQAVNCLQDDSHNDVIAAIAAAMLLVNTAKFVDYQEQIIKNAKLLYDNLVDKEFNVITDGSDFHFVVVDLLNMGITAEQGEKVLNAINISCNRCCIPDDDDPFNPHGLKFGMASLTSQKHDLRVDIYQLVIFIKRGLFIAKKIYCLAKSTGKTFDEIFERDEEILTEIENLKKGVALFAEELYAVDDDEKEGEKEDE